MTIRSPLMLLITLVFGATTNATAQQTFVTKPPQTSPPQTSSPNIAHATRDTFDLITPPDTATSHDDFGETARGSHFDLLPREQLDFTTHSLSLDAAPTSEADDVSFEPEASFAARPKDELTIAPRMVVDNLTDETQSERVSPDMSFRWKPAINQSLLFLAVQHGYAMTQPKTREALHGKFFKDYFRSVRSLHGWGDGGRFFTNYVAHSMQGALGGYIQIQNDPRGMKQKFGRDKAYWVSRAKAMAWSAAWSTQFEIGLISQASIGNVGMKGKQTWIDIVITPTVGTGLIVLEDALDRYTRPFIESRTNNKYIRIFSRMLLNPTRNFSNLLRFEKPWKRDVKY